MRKSFCSGRFNQITPSVTKHKAKRLDNELLDPNRVQFCVILSFLRNFRCEDPLINDPKLFEVFKSIFPDYIEAEKCFFSDDFAFYW